MLDYWSELLKICNGMPFGMTRYADILPARKSGGRLNSLYYYSQDTVA